jgi:RNA polymerase sigma factor (sigma-70 family)
MGEMPDDRQLLTRFADDGSEAAFGELVARHVALVYSAALRQTGGDAHLAQDIAQLVFTDLARKARALSDNVVLAGWLHRATIFAAKQILRGERRRRAREKEAVTMNAIQSESENNDWSQIRPLLDEALDRLDKTDRDALLLRFFEQQSLAQIGARLGSNEDAARKRVNRALEKLRAILAGHGVTTTAAALSSAIPADASQTVPAGLAAKLTKASFSAAGTGVHISWLKLMGTNQIKFAVCVLFAAGLTSFFLLRHQHAFNLHAQNESSAKQQPLPQPPARDSAFSINPPATAGAGFTAMVASNEPVDLPGEVEVLSDSGTGAEKSHAKGQPVQTLRRGGRAIWESQVMKEVSQACIIYALDHQLQFPTSLDQAAPYLTTGLTMEAVKSNCVIVFQGSMADITHPGRTAVVMGKESWQGLEGRWMKAYGFANGKGGVYLREQNDFSVFESRHTLPPPSNP